ncbi:uncharacterized protein BT62DRAFT_302905 [Guyanagaster necrorhizus]|uniref:F-box domain-containing protein n=1 Tax=Guyanagaster necrorhizus TaxID=856835 RepID=A0A9P7VPW3_9AGAR|nr:uncharacterized protein BT62DRAFT_302905 [Guyanagaster necrorhizus MCA 3950]KAG7443861.1 hypothetical protein BT62DRAFT_302905 [Guyanagaster necrorhizus MCA 3950]
MTSTEEPKLPLDILRELFEYAARADRHVALNLARVSTWAREWVDPILYHAISLHRESTIRNFLRTTKEKKHDFFLDHVKSLYLSVDIHSETDRIVKILTACARVTHLTIFFVPTSQHQCHPSCHSPERLGTAVSNLRPTHLSVSFPTILHGFYPELKLPFYSRLTHLSVVNDSTDWTAWSGFNSLRTLTHLALDVRQPVDASKAARICTFVASILQHCTQLRICVLLLLFTDDPRDTREQLLTAAEDRRVVFLRETEPFRDRDAREERVLWEKAEWTMATTCEEDESRSYQWLW